MGENSSKNLSILKSYQTLENEIFWLISDCEKVKNETLLEFFNHCVILCVAPIPSKFYSFSSGIASAAEAFFCHRERERESVCVCVRCVVTRSRM